MGPPQLRRPAAQATLLLVVIFAGFLAPEASIQHGGRHVRREVAMQADGFLDSKTGMSDDTEFGWSSVPRCAQELFGKHEADAPDEKGMKKLLPGIDAFYIIHDGANDRRKSRLETLMRDARLDGLDELATWVDWFNEEDLGKTAHADMACVFNKSYAEPMFVQSISAPLSRNLKHLWVYHEMVRRRLNNVLVIEDNPVFRGGLVETVAKLQELMEDLDNANSSSPSFVGQHIVMLGDSDVAQGHAWRAAEIEQSFEATHATQKVTEHLYGPGGLGHRGASGYVISGSSAAAVLRYVYDHAKVNAEADTLLENALGPDGFYWYVPPLWVQSESALMVEMAGGAAPHLLESRPSWQKVLPEEIPPDDNAADWQPSVNHQWSRYHH